MYIIGYAGKSGSGKTEAAGITASILGRRGYSCKLDTFADPVRKMAIAEFGVLDADDPEQRIWMQTRATEIREQAPLYFINCLFTRNNMDVISWGDSGGKWQPADFLIVHDVRMPNEVKFCRKHGVVIYMQGTHKPLVGAAAEHETETQIDELFHGADHIIVKQSSLSRLAAAVQALVDEGCHLKNVQGQGSPLSRKECDARDCCAICAPQIVR